MEKGAQSSSSYPRISNKQNIELPKRQGKAFKIKLSLSDGPFLPQDLMHSNQKSTQLHLITAKEVLQSQVSMSKTMKNMEKQIYTNNIHLQTLLSDKINLGSERIFQNKSLGSLLGGANGSFNGVNQVENFTNKCIFIKTQIEHIAEQSKKLKQLQRITKTEIKNSFSNIYRQNEQLVEGCLPVLRNFLKLIREHSQSEKNLFQDRKRDIQELKSFRDQFLDKIIDCEKKIMGIESFLGVSAIHLQEMNRNKYEDEQRIIEQNIDDKDY